MFNAWRFAGRDPYRLYNMLDEEYRPLAEPERGPLRPPYPERVKAFEIACAFYAEEIEMHIAGAKGA